MQLRQSKRILFVFVAIVILLLLISKGCDSSGECRSVAAGSGKSICKITSNVCLDKIKSGKVLKMAVRRKNTLEESIVAASNVILKVSKQLRELDTPASLSDVCAGYIDPVKDSVFYADGKDFIVLKSESRSVGFVVLYGPRNYRRIHIAGLPALMDYEVRNPFPAGYYMATGRYINEHSLQMYMNNSADDNMLHSPQYKMFCFESISLDAIGQLKLKLNQTIEGQKEKILEYEKLISDIPSWANEQEKLIEEQRRREKQLHDIEQTRRATFAQQQLSQIDFPALVGSLHIKTDGKNNSLTSAKATLDRLTQLRHENDWLGLLSEASILKNGGVSSNGLQQGNMESNNGMVKYPDEKSIEELASWLADIRLSIIVGDAYDIDILCVYLNELEFSSGWRKREPVILALKNRKYYIRSRNPGTVHETIHIQSDELADGLSKEMMNPWDFFDEGKREKIIQGIVSSGKCEVRRSTTSFSALPIAREGGDSCR